MVKINKCHFMWVLIGLCFFSCIIIITLITFEIIRVTCFLYPLSSEQEKFIDTKTEASFTLTTTPLRIYNIRPILESLLLQNPKNIYLNIPIIYKKTGEKYIIPDWLIKYQKEHDNIILNRVEDRGPATKLLGALEITKNNQNEYLCVLDDDKIYNKILLSNLLYRIKRTTKPTVMITRELKFKQYSVLEGVGSFMVKRNLLNGLKDFIMPEECYKVDDPWFSAYFKKNNVTFEKLLNRHYFQPSITQAPTNVFKTIKLFIKSIFTGPSQTINNNVDALAVTRQKDENYICLKKALHYNK
jgi:hypothetical protein